MFAQSLNQMELWVQPSQFNITFPEFEFFHLLEHRSLLVIFRGRRKLEKIAGYAERSNPRFFFG